MKRLLCIAIAATAGIAVAQTDAKGVYVEGAGSASQAVAAKYNIVVERDGEWKSVPASRKFYSGERFKLQIAVNRPGYVYVLHRTLEGDPDSMSSYQGAKGIDVVRTDTAGKRGYRLMYPAQATGMSNLIAANRVVNIPGTASFRMDSNPGMEKFLVIVSSKPLSTGDLPVAGASNRNDSDDSVTSQLSKTIDEFSANSLETVDSKGVDVETYVAPRDSRKPLLVNVDLRHYGRR